MTALFDSDLTRYLVLPAPRENTNIYINCCFCICGLLKSSIVAASFRS
jgi:hypothetical protein